MEFSPGPYSPASPLALQYSDAASTIYPDRPIRPLPRRRIRSRISSELAESILNTSPPAPTEKLFQIPYLDYSNINVRTASQSSSLEAHASDSIDGDQKENSSFNGQVGDGVTTPEQTTDVRREKTSWPPSLGTASPWNSQLRPKSEISRHNKANASQSVASSADSIDGYDSFENTNNKKKRKIPANGGHHSSLSAEMASMGISPARDVDIAHSDADGGVGRYYGTGNSAVPAKAGTNVSGAGRGRYSRASTRRRSTRSPLGVSVNGSNSGRRGPPSSDEGASKEESPTQAFDRGIISAAIANAASLPSTAANSSEHGSLVDQQSSKSTPQGKTQFTFTCQSDSNKGMSWPGYGYPSTPGAYPEGLPNGFDGAYDPGVATQAIQTVPGMTGQAHQSGGAGPQPAPPAKPRRPLSKQYAIAARDRRLRRNYDNFHHPPKEEDVWICAYCEYEAIFGSPPVALIRQYEMKDRRERRRLAEKRRLLEKAKMKGRKGKKGNKNSKNANNASQTQHANQKQQYDPQAIDNYPVEQPDLQTDDYVLDDYDEIPTPTMPTQPPSRIPQPTAQTSSQSQRLSTGTRGRETNSGGRPG